MIHVLSFVLIGITCLVSLEARAPILLISLDGYRADRFDNYLFNHPLSALYKEVAAVGVRSHMEPSFPSQNFPNHFTLVTGKFKFLIFNKYFAKFILVLIKVLDQRFMV